MSRKPLPKPKGMDETAAQLDAAQQSAEARHQPDHEPAAQAPPRSDAGLLGTRFESGRDRRRRRHGAGMTVRSYYLSERTAADLDEATSRIIAVAGGVPSKAEALDAVVQEALRHTDEIAAELRERVLRQLQSGADPI